MTRYQIAEAYMIFGGIPYYMSLMKSNLSLYQNVDIMYFSKESRLHNEFENLYRSLYENPDLYIRVVEALAKKGKGLLRTEIINEADISNGGSLTKILSDLEMSGFIRKYKSYGQKQKDCLYQLIDFFSLFDIRFREKRDLYEKNYWLSYSSTTDYSVWSGFSFEKLCLLHTSQIRKKLGISGVLTAVYSWKGKFEDSGAQVDLVIDRNDNVINLCETKFLSDQFTIQKSDSDSFRIKRAAFKGATKTRKSVITTLITTFGLKRNMYSGEITSEVTLDDLFL
jgi:hypothetical protein